MIVLDTHAWVWWMTKPERLGKKARRAVERAPKVGVPCICPWEVAVKAQAGKLRFDRPYELWIDEALAVDTRVEILALLPSIAVGAAQLSWEHADPADRFIVATARIHQAKLITADEQMHRSNLVSCVWD